ncbi:MAG: c-type cytochrome [Betaproteobacteria bacterium]
MKLAFATFAGVALLASGTAHAVLDNTQAEALMKKYACSACHSIDKKVVGPAYVDVAAKFKSDKNAVEMLSKKVKEGSVGVWGQIPMPPNSAVPAADIKELVTWILTLKK